MYGSELIEVCDKTIKVKVLVSGKVLHIPKKEVLEYKYFKKENLTLIKVTDWFLKKASTSRFELLVDGLVDPSKFNTQTTLNLGT